MRAAISSQLTKFGRREFEFPEHLKLALTSACIFDLVFRFGRLTRNEGISLEILELDSLGTSELRRINKREGSGEIAIVVYARLGNYQ